MGFESTLVWKLLHGQELREEPVIDAHRYTAGVPIHVHISVTRHGQFFKTPPVSQACRREASAAPGASFLPVTHSQLAAGINRSC